QNQIIPKSNVEEQQNQKPEKFQEKCDKIHKPEMTIICNENLISSVSATIITNLSCFRRSNYPNCHL
ncbi:hypothetical protein L9F63_012321, partial [Diploptera punctata]